MNWIPKNKTTGVTYPPVDDAGRAAMEADPQTKGKYLFLKSGAEAAVKSVAVKAAKEPVGVKKIQAPADPEPNKE